MKIRVKYDDRLTTIEIPDGDYSVMLDVDYEMRLAEAPEGKKDDIEKCSTVQEMFDLMNKGEYNNWHTFDRHRSYSKPQSSDDEGEVRDMSEPLMKEVVDNRIFTVDEENRNVQYEYDDCCEKIRAILKPDQAEMIIAIHLNGMAVQEYAAKIGDKSNNVSHRLKRAEKKLREILTKTSF